MVRKKEAVRRSGGQGIKGQSVQSPLIITKGGIGAQPVTFSFDSPSPILEDWPPGKDRYMPHYIHPGQDTFLIKPPRSYFQGCKLLIAVLSRTVSTQVRNHIRSTWKTLTNESCVVFVLGRTQNQDDIRKEAFENQDVLQAPMVDNYNNLTLKSVFVLKYFLDESNFDEKPFYLMKADDDCYINVPQLLKLLETKALQNSTLFMLGYRHGTATHPVRPITDQKSKWYVPTYMYNGRTFPVYINGPGYVTTRDAATCLYAKALDLPFFHIEDVFMSFAAERCKIPRYHCPGFHNSRVPLKQVKPSDILWTDLRSNEMESMHQLVNRKGNLTDSEIATRKV